MPKTARALSALEVRRLAEPGFHAVGTVCRAWRCCVKASGARSRGCCARPSSARRAELGLGGYPSVTLAQAFDRARQALDKIRAGTDPAAERRANRRAIDWTFKRTALAYIEAHRAGWKNARHAAQWTATLETYVFPVFGDKHVRDVGKADVLASIEFRFLVDEERDGHSGAQPDRARARLRDAARAPARRPEPARAGAATWTSRCRSPRRSPRSSTSRPCRSTRCRRSPGAAARRQKAWARGRSSSRS